MAPPQQQPPAGAFGSLDCDSAGDHDQPSSFGWRPQPSVRKRSKFAAPAYNVAPASRTTPECVARLRQSSPNESGPPEVSCRHGNSNESQEVHPSEFNSHSRTFSSSWQLDSFDGGATEDTGDVEGRTSTRDAPHLASVDEILVAAAQALRLPLCHIKVFVNSVRRTAPEWEDGTRKEYLAEIDLEADRLAQLVNSLLDVRTRRRSHTGATALAFTHPACVVQGALHRIRGLSGERPLRLDVSPRLPLVQLHANQMERVLANLIHDAIRHSPPGTPIGVSARITEQAELEFTVEDEELGVPADDRERTFEPFVRTQTAAHSKVSGEGLGLAICHSTVLAHGGRMQVSTRPVGGARFSVFMPAPLPTKGPRQ
jgi:signal transduction histidine kinase